MTDSTQEIAWDGVTYPYIPPAVLRIPDRLRLHVDVDDVVDPITHEVLRHALWNINEEHGNTIMRISGSAIAAYGHDFNPMIADEQGDFVFFGPFLQYLAAAAGSAMKWTMEHRAENPGIAAGDIFLTNDPWIGAVHQSDVALIAPVFVDGRLFCWVGNSLHQWDLGGTAPGGFNPMAPDAYWEAPCIPPVKIVEGGTLRRDIEEQYLRTSRVPKLVALDLRAEIAGCNVARDRILGLVERYSPATVKATMRKLQDDSETAFVQRLRTIPDGTWSEEGWMEVKLPGDRGLYKNRVEIVKRGDRLTFSNRGSAEQQGAICASYPAWKGAVVCMLNSMMLFDQMFAIEGALRCCDFDLEPGTISCALHPAAVSGAPPQTLQHSIGMSGLAISKMLASSTDAELRTEVQSCMGVLGFPVVAMEGEDQRGAPYSSFLLDPVGAALPAHAWHDGQDTGGFAWDLQSTIPNVEDNELFYPLLYLWRKELADSGGAGTFRGGNGCEAALVPHKTDAVKWVTIGAQVAIPGPGLFGGMPTSTNCNRHLVAARAGERARESGRMPGDVSELETGAVDWVPAKSFDRVSTPDDVWVFAWSGAGGYGDPLGRDTETVRDDVAAGRVTAAWARTGYGVVVTGTGRETEVDVAATEQRRHEVRAERLRDGRRPEAIDPAPGTPMAADGRITEHLVVRDGEFRSGDVSLGPADRNFKEGALLRELPLTAANPHIRDPSTYTDNDVRLREVICPETGRLLATEIVVDGAAPEWDIRPGQVGVAPDGGREGASR
jgi:N-methylhydantoinase B